MKKQEMLNTVLMLNTFPYALKKRAGMAGGIKGCQILSDVEMVNKLFT